MSDQLRALLVVAILFIVSGIGDAQGFLHAAKIWEGGKLIWSELGKSTLGFIVGIVMYWLAVPFFQQVGTTSPLIQTLAWFGITIIGVAVLTGDFLHWATVDQLVAGGVLIGIGWLVFRTSSG